MFGKLYGPRSQLTLLIGMSVIAVVWTCPVLGQDGESEKQESMESEGRPSDAKNVEKSPRVEVRREPIYDHRPGRSGRVGWTIVYSDGTRKTVTTEGAAGANDSSATKPNSDPARGNQSRSQPNAEEVQAKIRQLLGKSQRIVEMAEDEVKKIADIESEESRLTPVIQGLEQRIKGIDDSVWRTETQIPHSRPTKRPVPPLYQCSRGEPFELCKHYVEKQASIRARIAAIEYNAAVDQRLASIDRQKRQQENLRRQKSDLQAQLTSKKQQFDGLRRDKIECQQRKAEWLGQLSALKRVIAPYVQKHNAPRPSGTVQR